MNHDEHYEGVNEGITAGKKHERERCVDIIKENAPDDVVTAYIIQEIEKEKL